MANSPPSFIVFYSWISSSFPRPPAKRAVALAMINAFSQLGNVAGMYVWDLPEHGYRKSYGIVTAMFGVTIVGCYIVRILLVRENKKLEAGQAAWESHQDVADKTATISGAAGGNEVKYRTGFRYLL